MSKFFLGPVSSMHINDITSLRCAGEACKLILGSATTPISITRTRVPNLLGSRVFMPTSFIMRPSSLGGGRILRRTLSVCPSSCLAVRPSSYRSFRQPLASRMYCPASVTSRHLANYNDTDVLFGTH